MSSPLFVFIESNTSGTGVYFVEEAKRQGLRPVVLAANPKSYQGRFAEDVTLHEVDTTDVDAIIAWIQRFGGGQAQAVYSSSDYFVGMAALVAERLGLPGPSALAIRECREKLTQRKRLSEAGLLMPTSILVTHDAQIAAAYQKAGPRVVIKPQTGSGSYGVRYADCLDDAYEWAAKLLEIGTNERGQPFGGVLIESYLCGNEYSVEVFDAQAVIVTEKHLSEMPFFIEVGHDMPAALTESHAAALMACAQAAVKALNLGWGPVHVELRNTADGPVIIEVNPRLAGGFLPTLVKLCTGVDLIAATVAKAAGTAIEVRKTLLRHAGIRFFRIERAGRLMDVENWIQVEDDEALVEARLYAQIGDERQVHHDFRDRFGHVIASGEDRARMVERLDRAMNRPRFKWVSAHE
jgi:biotin carboxylase